MYRIGDAVFYGVHGVCSVADVAERTFGGVSGMYYILKPVHSVGSNTLFVSVDRPNLATLLRPLLDKDALSELIASIPSLPTVVIADSAERKDAYAAILKSGDRSQIASVLKTLYAMRRVCEMTGKKMHAADERAAAEAERILFEEIAYVFDIPKAEVPTFLSRAVGDAW